MTIRVLAFGIAKDIVGGAYADIVIGEGATIRELRARLEKQYPRLGQLSTFMLALNNEYANGTEQLTGNDEVALIPPVSGG